MQTEARLRARVKNRVSGKADKPTPRPPVVRFGVIVNTATALVESKRLQLVAITHDVDPI